MKLGRWMSPVLGLAFALALLGSTALSTDAMQIFVKTLTGKTFTVAVYQDSAGDFWVTDGVPTVNAAGEAGYTAEDIIVDRATGATYTLVAWIFESVRQPGVYTVIDLNSRPVDDATAATAVSRLSSGLRIPA